MSDVNSQGEVSYFSRVIANMKVGLRLAFPIHSLPGMITAR